VKLGGVILTGGAGYGYTITNVAGASKVELSAQPEPGYELEVRAISVGASMVSLEGTMVSPIREVVSVGAAIGGATNLDLRNKQVYLFDSDASANFSLNLRGDESNTIDALLGIGESISATVVVRMGASLKSLTAVNIDGAAVTVNWQNTSKDLTASKLNVISLVAVKTASGVYTVIGSVSAAGTV
jgi:hypothetical protein